MSRKVTFVTGYFKLPGYNSQEHINQAAKLSLSISHPLVIYCEQDTVDQIRAERDKYGYLTRYIVKPLNTFEFYNKLETIKKNRLTRPRVDVENTPEYMISSCNKVLMLQETVSNNIFDSTHFAWINFTLPFHETYSNLNIINNIVANISNKIRMCFINYTPKADTLDLEKYYHQNGKCGIAGSFFTGSRETMLKYTKKFIDCFNRTVDSGYGHGDEQLILQVYFEQHNITNAELSSIDLMEFYFGDYQHVLCNYLDMVAHDSKHALQYFILPNAYKDNNMHIVKSAVKYLMNGYKKKLFDLSTDDLCKIIEYLV
jgi:hypothetical protein